MLDQLDEALDLIKKEVTLKAGGTYQMSGVCLTLKKDLIEEDLNIKYVQKMQQLHKCITASLPNCRSSYEY